MNRLFALLIVIICSVVHVSMVWPNLEDQYGILDQEAYELEKNQDQPTLHSVPGDEPHWETYNQWLCFSSHGVEVDCYDDDLNRWEDIDPDERDGRGYYSIISVDDYNGRQYTIESPSRTSFKSCMQEVEEAKALIEGQQGFCVFVAKWPSVEEARGTSTIEESTLWLIYGLKTKAGQIMAPIYDYTEVENIDPGEDP